ncbi:hypothetical protein SC206_05950 [Rouxiella sp. T17]
MTLQATYLEQSALGDDTEGITIIDVNPSGNNFIVRSHIICR